MIPTSTNVSVDLQEKRIVAAEATAIFVPEGAKEAGEAAALLDEDERQAVARLLASGASRGKAKELQVGVIGDDDAPKSKTSRYRRIIVIGLGPVAKLNAEVIRQAAGALARAVRKHRVKHAMAIIPAVPHVAPAAVAQALVEGILLASFNYEEYKGTVSKAKEADEVVSGRISISLLKARDHSTRDVQNAVSRARVIADGQNFARTIGCRPGNNINPPSLAIVAQQMAREAGLGIRMLDEKAMKGFGMGGILAVGGGSATPPRMIVLEHRPGGKSKAPKSGGKKNVPDAPLLVVGKSITFDTGGISIKGADRMGKMIYDKCGGMAVLGFMYIAAKLNLPIHIVGILSSAENTLGSGAYRPGDILRMCNGVTVEVTNTDAEGRLVLGDALAWGIETFKPSQVVDLATLTGGVIVALGSTMAGVMTNNDALMAELSAAADKAGEQIWRLPLNDDHREYIKSHHADIMNSAGREGQPLQGGAFLSHFVPKDNSVPWAHLDIAGVADTDKELPYYSKGATGWGVRTLVEWAAAKSAAVPPKLGSLGHA